MSVQLGGVSRTCPSATASPFSGLAWACILLVCVGVHLFLGIYPSASVCTSSSCQLGTLSRQLGLTFQLGPASVQLGPTPVQLGSASVLRVLAYVQPGLTSVQLGLPPVRLGSTSGLLGLASV